MSIIFFCSKFYLLVTKNDANFLTNETIFSDRGGEGAAICELSQGRQKTSTIYFAPTPFEKM